MSRQCPRQNADSDDANSFVGLKLLMGIQLLSYATRRRAGMEARAAADIVNDFGRDPIGEGKEEQVRRYVLSHALRIPDSLVEIQPRPQDDFG